MFVVRYPREADAQPDHQKDRLRHRNDDPVVQNGSESGLNVQGRPDGAVERHGRVARVEALAGLED